LNLSVGCGFARFCGSWLLAGEWVFVGVAVTKMNGFPVRCFAGFVAGMCTLCSGACGMYRVGGSVLSSVAIMVLLLLAVSCMCVFGLLRLCELFDSWGCKVSVSG